MGVQEPSILSTDLPQGSPAPNAPMLGDTTVRDRPATASRAAAGRSVIVAGFWRRTAAALIDLAVLLPVVTLFTWLAGRLAGLHLPRTSSLAPDYWLDLALAGEPALWGSIGLAAAMVVIYLLVFQATLAHTPGMRVMRLRVIDLYGEPPALWRAALRTAGYLVCTWTIGLGFLWVGFDREKRGLHDWLAGTYVIRDGLTRGRA